MRNAKAFLILILLFIAVIPVAVQDSEPRTLWTFTTGSQIWTSSTLAGGVWM